MCCARVIVCGEEERLVCRRSKESCRTAAVAVASWCGLIRCIGSAVGGLLLLLLLLLSRLWFGRAWLGGSCGWRRRRACRCARSCARRRSRASGAVDRERESVSRAEPKSLYPPLKSRYVEHRKCHGTPGSLAGGSSHIQNPKCARRASGSCHRTLALTSARIGF